LKKRKKGGEGQTSFQTILFLHQSGLEQPRFRRGGEEKGKRKEEKGHDSHPSSSLIVRSQSTREKEKKEKKRKKRKLLAIVAFPANAIARRPAEEETGKEREGEKKECRLLLWPSSTRGVKGKKKEREKGGGGRGGHALYSLMSYLLFRCRMIGGGKKKKRRKGENRHQTMLVCYRVSRSKAKGEEKKKEEKEGGEKTPDSFSASSI